MGAAMRRGAVSALRSLVVLAGVAAASPAPTSAQESSTGFRFGFGWQEPGGDVGGAFDGNVDAEFSILIPVSAIRIGGGANWVSFDVTGAEASWSQIKFHTLVGVPFRLTERVHPWVEGRWTYRHLRPEDDRYFGGEDRVLRDVKSEGHGLELAAGVALFVSTRVAIDLSGSYGTFSIDPDLSDEGLGALDSGSAWRIQTGISWFPTHRP